MVLPEIKQHTMAGREVTDRQTPLPAAGSFQLVLGLCKTQVQLCPIIRYLIGTCHKHLLILTRRVHARLQVPAKPFFFFFFPHRNAFQINWHFLTEKSQKYFQQVHHGRALSSATSCYWWPPCKSSLLPGKCILASSPSPPPVQVGGALPAPCGAAARQATQQCDGDVK